MAPGSRLTAQVLTTLVVAGLCSTKYAPSWQSLDTRPLPAWYDDAKVGIFIHWGVFSVPAFSNEWFWWDWSQGDPDIVQFMEASYPPSFTYTDFAADYTARFFNATEWAQLFQASGAKCNWCRCSLSPGGALTTHSSYVVTAAALLPADVVLTSKHHEGYTNWPSKYSYNWNSEAVGPGRDLVGELTAAIKHTTSLRSGLYHSMFEWFHPLYLDDRASNWTTQEFVAAKTGPELYELVQRYEPELLWSDGDHEAPSSYWDSTTFLAWLYNDSPVRQTVVVNDRWGQEVHCQHGDFFTCADRFNPGVLQRHKWENCQSVDKLSWGFRRNMRLEEAMTREEILEQLVSTVACNGNLLLNVGPTADGVIPPIFQERLREMGDWLSINGEAIYGSRPWKEQKDPQTPGVWYTQRSNSQVAAAVYATSLKWPEDDLLWLSAVTEVHDSTSVTLLGWDEPIPWKLVAQGGLILNLMDVDRQSIYCDGPWAFKIQG